MCQWYCTSEGPFTNLHCLHCHVRYCGACLHGEAGKMESLVRCAGCGKKPRVKANATRRAWGGEVRSPQGTSKAVLRPPQRGQNAQTYWAYKHAQANDGNFSWDNVPTHRSIFDKLTDPSLYTGSHKHRFDEEGRGRGLEGRDSVGKGMGTGAVLAYYGEGPVVSIAQLVRNDKLDPQHMNKLRRFPDGSTVLSPGNRGLKMPDGKWRPEQRSANASNFHPSLAGSPSGSPGRSPHGSPSSRALSGSQSARSLRSPQGGTSALSPSVHEINKLTAAGRGLYGGDYAQPGQYAPQQRGPVGPYSVEAQQQRQREMHHLQLQQQMQHLQLGEAAAPTMPLSARTPQRQASQPSLHSSSHHAAGGYPFDALSHPSHHPSARPSTASYHPSPIFDKLTDPAQYTGASRERFDDAGRGKGLAGRVDLPPERYQGDSYASSDIKDLSQITRQNFNIGSPQGKTHKFHY